VKVKSNLPKQYRNNNSTLKLLAGITFILLAPHVNAAEVTKKAILTGGVTYDSNPALTSSVEHSVFTYSLAPQLLVDVNDEANKWYLDASVLVERHSTETVLINREDPRLTVGWDRTYESGMFGIKAGYKENSSLDQTLRTTGIFTQVDNTEKTKEVSAKWQQTINSRLSILTDAAYDDISFTKPGSLFGYQLSEIGAKLTYETTETLNTYGQLGYSHFSTDNIFGNTDLTHLGLGADFKVNEHFNIGARAGANNLSGAQSRTNWDAGLKGDFTAEKMVYSAALSRGEMSPSVAGGFQETDSIVLGWLYNISDNGKLGADFSFNKYKQDSHINLPKENYRQFGAYYERNLTIHWQTRVSAYRRELDASNSNSSANVLGVTLAYDTLSF